MPSPPDAVNDHAALDEHSTAIFQEQYRANLYRTDRLFAGLLAFEWLAGIFAALVISPRSWEGLSSQIHMHVWAAVFLGGAITGFPIFLALARPAAVLTRHSIAVGQMLYGALLIHLTGGRLESHFHVFGSLAFLAFYRDWRVLITGSAVVAGDHFLRGFFWPQSVYGVLSGVEWRWLEHAGWVVFEDMFLITSCLRSVGEMKEMAHRQAQLEVSNRQIQQANEVLEIRVQERTHTLTKEIIDRWQAQGALSRQTRVLQSILNNMGEAVVVADLDGNFTLVNPAADRLVGIPHRNSNWCDWPAQYGAYRPDRSTPFPAADIPLVRAIRGESCDDVEIFLRNSGRPDGIYVNCNARPIRDEEGVLTGGVVVFHDLTERKLAEEALAERARLSALTADVAVALTRSDDHRTVLQQCGEAVVQHLEVACARIWTLNEKDQMLELQASAGTCTQLEGPHSRVPLGQFAIGKIAKEQKPHLINGDFGAGSGSDSECTQLDGAAVFAGYPLIVGQRVLGVMAVYSRASLVQATLNALAGVADTIALGLERFRFKQGLAKAKEEKIVAEVANRAKSEFLSRMSHELRTPLNAILGFGQLLDMAELPEEHRECVEQINRGGKHLLGMINEVLDIARIEAGRMHLSPEPVRVAEVFNEALELVRPLGAGQNIQFSANLEAINGHCVLADNQKLKQVLLNLLSNAIKYNRKDGDVRLTCEASTPDRLCLSVSDTGQGIAPEKLSRLFVPFDRLGAEQTGVEGSGLGLALSRALVELMGGTLTVVSSPGEGCRFSIELACAQDPQHQLDDEVMSLQMHQPACGTRKVLYIEDNLDNLRLIQRVLAHRPSVGLLTAMQGTLGIDLAREHRPDLILLDVHLPDLNGDQVLKRLRAEPATRSIPVIVISADATARQIEHLRAAGAQHYLTKPIDVAEFLKTVDAVLQKDK